MQTTLLGFAIALILALLAALVGPYFIDWNDHRAFFEAEASRLVGVPVRVTGKINAGILPVPSITLRQIAIGPEHGAGRLRARSLRVELGLGPLMRGEMRATEMRLVAPQFSIGLDRQGQIDWPPLALAAETLAIDRLKVDDARVTLTDAASGSRLLLERLGFTGSVRSLAGPFRGSGEFVSGGGRYGYDISTGRQGPDGTRIKLTLKTEQHPLSVEAEGVLAFARGAPGFEGTLTLARPAGAVLANGQAVANEPWQLTSKVQAGPTSAVLESVAFQYGPEERGAALSGSAEFRFGARPELQGRLSARQIDLDRLLATVAAPRRVPLAVVQAFGELLGGALRPSWPVKLALNVDSMIVGGAAVQQINCDLQSDDADWTVERLAFRAPGFTNVKVRGRLYPLGDGLGFAGPTAVDSSDPKVLTAWLTGRTSPIAQIRPWHASGDLTLGADRIAVENLQTEFGRGDVTGSVSYAWPDAKKPARLEANLRAAELDVDAAVGFGMSALSGLGLETPREVKLAIEIERARIAALEARNVAARLSLDGNALAIERLSIADFGSAGIEASGRIETKSSPGGTIALDLNARDLDGVIALSEKAMPVLAVPLRRLAGRQKSAMLHADVSLANLGTDEASAQLAVKGKVGAVRLNVSASATGKRDAFTVSNPHGLGDTDIKLDGQIEADEPTALLALLGLDRIPVAEGQPAHLSISAHGPPSRDFSFDGKLDAGPIAATGKGVLRLPDNQPAELNLDHIAGTIAGDKVHGRLALRFDDVPQVDGSIEAETLDAPATIAAAIGMTGQHGAAAASGWSTDPLAWGLPGMTGRIAFKAQHARFAPDLTAQALHGVVRFGGSELAFEDVAGEMAKGGFDGRLVFTTGADGLTARVRVGLSNADAAAMFPHADGPAVSGRLSAQGEVEGTGRSPAAFIGSLAGTAAMTLERGQIAGINPGVFDTVGRAVELGIPIEGDRIRQFVTGVLDSGKVPVPHAKLGVSINAGQARFDEITLKMPHADLRGNAGINLADGTLDALLTLTGAPPAEGAKIRPTLLIGLNGPAMTPKRSVDTSLLTSWLTLLTVERQSRQLDAMERAARAAATPKPDAPNAAVRQGPSLAPERGAAKPAEPSGMMSGEIPPGARAPVLPPPLVVPPAPRPRATPRNQGAAPPGVFGQPPALVGAQN